MTDRKDCNTCKHIILCNIDKQAFYKFADKQCEGYKAESKAKKKCKYSKYTKRLDNCRFDCSDCPIEKSLDSILKHMKEDGYDS